MDKRYNPNEWEPRAQALWQQQAAYQYRPEQPGEVFWIDTPPPTVSGSLHIGHIFSYTQAEIIARYKRMQGYKVFYPFGFDDNGLPTERLVEKEQGIRARDLPREEFAARCAETAGRYEEEFTKLWKSLGFSVDWSLLYQTNSPLAQRISQRSFLRLARAKKAYCKSAPSFWCTECCTGIAQAELETVELPSEFHTLRFECQGMPLAIATTRPELLYGCVAVFVHPEDARYQHLVGKEAKVPLYDLLIPILADESVEPEKGTGAVMCATFGDITDTQWVSRYDLPDRRVIMPDGALGEEVPLVGGMKVNAARRYIVALLKQQDLLLESRPLTHPVAVHERCGKPVEILPARQWYIDVLSQKARYLQAADEIRWHPEGMKARYLDWVSHLKWDWCISRQRYFGVPIPVWYCRACGQPMLAKEEDLPVNPLEQAAPEPCPCGCETLIGETGVLDTWATSSMTPEINARWEEDEPRPELLPQGGLRAQAHEIIRTWAFYTMIKSLYHHNRIPWKDIMISGFVLAKPGEKISKSKGNDKLSPKALVEGHSADVIRYWAAGARLGTDTFFSQRELTAGQKLVTKLWNAARFAQPLLEGYAPGMEPARLLPVDRWLLARVDQTLIQARGQLDQYEIGLACREIDGLFWNDFCDDYLEIAKERLYQGTGESRLSGQYALYRGLMAMLKLYAIYVPHVTEAIYQQIFREKEETTCLHQTLWPKQQPPDERILAFGQAMKAAVADARRQKTQQGLSMKAPLEQLTIPASQEILPLLMESREDIKACTRAEKIVFLPV